MAGRAPIWLLIPIALGRERTQRIAHNTVYVGGEHASQVILPLIPART